MKGKELLKKFKLLSESSQNKILVNAYKQIAVAHDNNNALQAFTWRDCEIDGEVLTINVPTFVSRDYTSRLSDLKNYAAVIYCLTTGKSSAEAMDWDAGRKIKSPVLREIVLTICGRNVSIEPLLSKLRQPYVDEETFFEDYNTVDEKECMEAYEKREIIETQNRLSNTLENKTNRSFYCPPKRSWSESIGIFILMGLCYGGYHACKQEKAIKQENISRSIEQSLRQSRERHEQIRDLTFSHPIRLSKNIDTTNNTDSIRI